MIETLKIQSLVALLLVVFIHASCWSSESNNQPQTGSKWETISTSSSNSSHESKSNDIVNRNTNIEARSGGFMANLPAGFTQPSDDVSRRLLKEYGATFIARGGVSPPNAVVFKNDAEVAEFQSEVQSSRESISGVSVELQSAAMNALKDAVSDAAQSGVSITPRGADASRRTYQDTVGLWASRIAPGLTHWSGIGRISAADVQRIRSLSPYDQVPEIFRLESQGIYFSKDLSKSIIYSVAPPGSSQHLSMLALDVSEHDNAQVRSIMAKHGWFQTVVSDLPHFTFLGVAETELPKLGLKKVSDGGRDYWVPAI